MKNLSAIILLFIANTISGIAQGMSMIAIPWYFAQQQILPTFIQGYLLTNFLILFWAPYCGTLIDKYNRKHLFLVLNVVVGVILLGVASWGVVHGALEWYWVLIVFTLTFVTYNLHYPNLYAFIQELSEEKYYGSITSFIEIQGQLSAMMAGAGATVLLSGISEGGLELMGMQIAMPFVLDPWPIHKIFMLDGFTYLASFVVIWFIQYVPLKKRKVSQMSLVAQLKIGIDYLRQHIELFIFGIASYLVFVTILMEGFLLGAAYVKDHLQESGAVYALSDIFYAIGAVFIGLTIRFLFKYMSLPKGIIILTSTTAMVFFMLFANKSVTILFLALFIIGITNAGVRIMRTTFLFQKIPNEVFGRTASIFALSNILLRIMLLGIFLLPIFHVGNNIRYTFLLLSIFLAIGTVILIVNYPKIMATKSSAKHY